MARVLSSIVNTDAPNSAYPSGKIRNKNASASPAVAGTPIVEEIYGDIIQFFYKLARLATIELNNLPDNEVNGFQFLTALDTQIRKIRDEIIGSDSGKSPINGANLSASQMLGTNAAKQLISFDAASVLNFINAYTKQQVDGNINLCLKYSNNLSEIQNKNVARTNLDVYSKLEVDAKASVKTGFLVLGDIQGDDQKFTVSLGVTLASTNYMVSGSLVNLSPSLWDNNNDCFWTIGNKTNISFDLYIHTDASGHYENLRFEYIIFYT